MGPARFRSILGLGFTASLLGSSLVDAASAQDLEPRRWTHLPVDINVLGAGAVYLDGDLAFDPLLEIEDAVVESQTAALRYIRTFELGGRSARVDAILPYARARWSGQLAGEPATTRREGFGDPILRLSVNLIGAPALSGKEYATFRKEHQENTVVGAAVAVGLPLGDYEEDKLLNLGANRFSIRPQAGVLHTRGPWSFELTGSTFLFTDNDEFLNDKRLERDPLFTVQAHVVRTLSPGWWVAAGAAHGWGGEHTVDGLQKNDDRKDILFGASMGMPITATQGLSLAYVGTRTDAAVGADSDSVILGWSVRF